MQFIAKQKFRVSKYQSVHIKEEGMFISGI